MIDAIINKLLALPKLAVSPEILEAFLHRTNDIIFHGKPITLAAFKADFEDHPETSITKAEMESIEHYLKIWEELMPALVQFTQHIQAGWKCTHDKPIGADDLVPLFIAFFSLKIPLLPELHEKLKLARDVNVSNYFINLLCSACAYLLTNGDLNHHDIQKCLPFIRDLFFDNGLFLLTIEKELQRVCYKKIEGYAENIYSSLKTHQIDTFDFDSANMDKEKKIEMQTAKIITMYASINDHPFTSYPELGEDVKKFFAFNEFSISLSRTKSNNVFERLREFTYKFEQLENSLGKDLEGVYIRFRNHTKHYLNIPDEKRPSILLLLWIPPEDHDMRLREFMDYLAPKILQLEVKEEAKKSPASDIISAVTFA